jgi:hypothetical protein
MFRAIRSDGRSHWPDDEQTGNYAQSPSRARSRLRGHLAVLGTRNALLSTNGEVPGLSANRELCGC